MPPTPPWAAGLPADLQAGAAESSVALAELLASGDNPAFTIARAIENNAAWCSLPEGGIGACLQLASQLVDEPSARPALELAWHIWRLLFPNAAGSADAIQSEYGPTPAAALPAVLPPLGAQTPTMYLLLLLGGVDQLLAQHARRGIPERVTRDTLSDIAVWTRANYTGGLNPLSTRSGGEQDEPPSGVWGLENLGWPMRTMSGELLRIGRLQHRLDTHMQPFSVYRERGGARRVRVVCAEPGVAFDSAGIRCEAAAESDGIWLSQKHEQLDGASLLVTGIDGSSGLAIREPLTELAPLSDWELLLQPGDKVLEMHIPEDGPMGLEAVAAGMRDAAAHWDSWYPTVPRESSEAGGPLGEEGLLNPLFKVFTCTSWMLDPEYQRRLSPRSNVVRLQKACHLFPLSGSGGPASGYERIFSGPDRRLTCEPREGDTSMQAAFLAHLRSGGRWVGGGAVVLADEIDQFGRAEESGGAVGPAAAATL